MTTDTPAEIAEGLAVPFTDEDIEWRIGHAMKDGSSALVLPYVTNRAIMERLDKVVGPENWQNEYIPWREKGVLCILSIRIGGEWIAKQDGADQTDVEPTKGGFSDAMKRTAVQWGMSRDLYKLPPLWWPHVKKYGDNKYKLTSVPTLADCLASNRGAAAPPATRPLRDDRAPASPRAEPDTGRSRQGPIPIPPPCPICDGPMWDNRDRRAAAEAKWVAKGSPDPKPNFQPAWKCKDGKWDAATRTASGCQGKYFPSDPNEERKTGSVPARRPDLEPRDDDQKPLTDADIPF